MNTSNARRFKGEIERYLNQGHNRFESRINDAFTLLNIKTWLCRAGIIKKDGFHAAHLLFVLIILPMLKVKTIHSFCGKFWTSWSQSQKDAFYRLKRKQSYRWRSFLHQLNLEIFKKIQLNRIPLKERYFILDDTIFQKRGKKMENISFVHDHSAGRSLLGFCIVTLALFNGKSVYPLDFAYRFGQKRHPKSPKEVIGDFRTAYGKRCFESKYCSKLELGQMMIEQAVSKGIVPGYVLFDSWYAWPSFINSIRNVDPRVHVVCRLKQSRVQYEYNGTFYTLGSLYQKTKARMKKDHKTGLTMTRVTVSMPDSDEDVVIVFTKGYKEPELDETGGKKKEKQSKWAAFLSTDTSLHASTIIRKYIRRWPIEVCFKECKQMLELGKDQANDFQSQIAATTISFLRYNLLNYLNETENYQTLGGFFDILTDEMAVVTYAQRLYGFFMGLFQVGISKIFELLGLEGDFQSYVDIITGQLSCLSPFRGCET